MATKDAPDGEPRALDGAVLAQGFDGVLAAGGHKAAAWGREGGDARLVEINGDEHNADYDAAQEVNKRFHLGRTAWEMEESILVMARSVLG